MPNGRIAPLPTIVMTAVSMLTTYVLHFVLYLLRFSLKINLSIHRRALSAGDEETRQRHDVQSEAVCVRSFGVCSQHFRCLPELELLV